VILLWVCGVDVGAPNVLLGVKPNPFLPFHYAQTMLL